MKPKRQRPTLAATARLVRLEWSDSIPTQPGWYLHADNHVLSAGYVGKKDIRLANTTQHQWLGGGKWHGPIENPLEPTPNEKADLPTPGE